MTARDNLISMYRRMGYALAPVALPLCPALREQYSQRAGSTPFGEYFDYPEGFAVRAVPGLEIRVREPVDWTKYYAKPLAPGTTFGAYGVAHEPGGAAAMHMTRMHHPLENASDIEELQSYPFPDYDLQSIGKIRSAVDSVHAQGLAAVGGMQCTVWENAWYIRSMPQLMMDMMAEDEMATFILDKITGHACQRAAAFAAAGVDIVELGDDIGMQSAPMMSIEMYETWLKPRLAQVIAAARAEKPDILVFYHSCGFVKPFIPSLIEVGVDILNPVQPECMDFAELHAEYGHHLSFNGTVGTQTTMPFGTPDEVRKVVHRNLKIAGAAGGLFCCPTHLLEPEVPWANVEAYVQACKEFTP